MPIKAVQQFQLGTVLNSEKQALATMERMKAAGYEGMELCSFMIHSTPFMVRMLTKAAGMPTGNGGRLNWPNLIKQSGLKVPAVHQYLNSIEEDIEAAAWEALEFGAKYIVVTGMYRFDYSNASRVKELAERLDRAGEKLLQNGVQLLYHNHNVEFGRTTGGKSAYEILVEETDAAYVNFEFDSYWAADAGVDPLHVMQGLGKRLKLYHINDRGNRKKGAAVTPIVKQDSMELGTGNMNLKAMLACAEAAGVDAVILESHKNWIDNDPCKSFEVSAEFLKHYMHTSPYGNL